MEMDLIDYLSLASQRGASDLHLCSGASVTARINGKLVPLSEQPLDGNQSKTLIFDVLKETQRATLEAERELDFAIHVEGLGRFRANAHYARGRVEAAFRFIPETVPDLDGLGHEPIVKELCKKHEGLILVTGITGSGKTTTLAAMTKQIAATRPGLIITIEDPIEYIFDHPYGLVKQRQVGTDTHGFANALRSALRQDPDVIIVSELRDLESIRTAISAAETGHLVIGTLHTLDAPKSMDRIVDVFPESQQNFVTSQLANCLQAVISQRLLPTKDGKGRALASEVMIATSGIRTMIREHKFEQIPSQMEISSNVGMHTLDASLLKLVGKGLIDLNTALSHAKDTHRIQQEGAILAKKAQQTEKSGGFFGFGRK